MRHEDYYRPRKAFVQRDAAWTTALYVSAVLMALLAFAAVRVVTSSPVNSTAPPDDLGDSVTESQPTSASSESSSPEPRDADSSATMSPQTLVPVRDDDSLLSQVTLSGPALALLTDGVWVPQVSAKCVGLPSSVLRDGGGELGFADGAPSQLVADLTEQDIVDFHRELTSQLRADLLFFRAPGGDTGPCSGELVWVAIANMPFPAKEQAQLQCDSWGLPDSECDPLQVTDKIIEHGRYRPYMASHGETGFAIDVPVAMGDGRQSGGTATFTDESSGSKLTMQLLDTGHQIPGLLDAKAQLRRDGMQVTLDEPEDNGYRLSGIDAEGVITYVRVYDAGGPAARLTWVYPQSQQPTYGPAIEYATLWFGPVNGF